MPQPSPLFYNPSLLTRFPQTHLVPFWALPEPPLRQIARRLSPPLCSLSSRATFSETPPSHQAPSVRSLPAPYALLFCLWCLHNKLLPNSVASDSHLLCPAIRTGHSAEGVGSLRQALGYGCWEWGWEGPGAGIFQRLASSHIRWLMPAAGSSTHTWPLHGARASPSTLAGFQGRTPDRRTDPPGSPCEAMLPVTTQPGPGQPVALRLPHPPQ